MSSKIKTNGWSILLHFLVNKTESYGKLLNLDILEKVLLQLYISIYNWKRSRSDYIPII